MYISQVIAKAINVVMPKNWAQENQTDVESRKRSERGSEYEVLRCYSD